MSIYSAFVKHVVLITATVVAFVSCVSTQPVTAQTTGPEKGTLVIVGGNDNNDAIDVQVDLKGVEGFDLNLYLHDDEPAFRSNAKFASCSLGASKQIHRRLTAGRWFTSVECESTVEAVLDETQSHFNYRGNTDVLNGVEYSITINQLPTQ